MQKAISPATSVRPQPGLPGQIVQVKLAAQNTGTLWLKRLVVEDTDEDSSTRSTSPAPYGSTSRRHANRVRVDVCTTDCAAGDFVDGTATASDTPTSRRGRSGRRPRLPGQLQYRRRSFTIRPGGNLPARGPCTAASICIDVPRVRPCTPTRAKPCPAPLGHGSAGYETTRQNGALADPDSTATHELNAGTARLRFDKSSDIAAGPGDRSRSRSR